MRRHELSDEDARRILAGHVRNHMGNTGCIFSPWYGLDLSISDGQLWKRVQATAIPLVLVEDLYGMSDEDIEQHVVLGGYQ